ncbi:type II toxin-antitoxin system Phd/YefM family antitoxin [Asticcacaulis sp.]|uniref:type II toxin-antitoxin system Phd/YefM family antitoxin n=1 Tax=Asticcacaulis sp. TaxID=1872648 RepID=UPI003F7CBB28
MVTVTATEFAKNFGRYREAVHREPVAVTSHERIAGYFLSSEDFEAYQRLKAMLPRAYAAHEMPAETLQALHNVRMDNRHDHLNVLLDE